MKSRRRSRRCPPHERSNGGQSPVLIIKRVKKGGHEAHHGGAWKVAYADFVTAMMAFFLLLWLLNATTEEHKKGISDYFAPANASLSMSGSGGVLGGTALTRPGALTSRSARPSVSLPLQPSAGTDEEKNLEGGSSEQKKKGSPSADSEENSEDKEITNQEADKLLAKRETDQFDKATEELREAIEDSPELHDVAKHVLVDQTPEGLRIQIVDQEGKAMFPLGVSQMLDRTRALLAKVAQVVNKLPNKIVVTGHTDATPFRSAARKNYGNWELSTERALASRRALVEGGLSDDRVAKVTGQAGKDLLVPKTPNSPRNRRISIILLRTVPTGASAEPKTAKLGAPAP